jgi:hypothetical protein
MSQQIADLRKRVLEDQEFRRLLKMDTGKALESVGIRPTPENVALIRNVISSIDHLYEGFAEEDRYIT